MRENKRPLLIAITGNIGSGKSSICLELERQGASVIYADALADKYLYLLKDTWLQRWGSDILNGEELDRGKISTIVFNHPSERQYLNSIIHPRVLQDCQRIIDESREAVLFFEIPLLFEADLQDSFDYLVLITTALEVLLQRVQQRDGSKPEDILKRLATQIPDAGKADRVDLVIDNSGSFEASRRQILSLLSRIDSIPLRNTKALY